MFSALRTIAIFTIVIAWSPICTAQFANAYVHLMSDDHTAVVQSIAKKHYIQASTTMNATKDIHLMKIDAAGNVVLDKIFFSPSGNEVALDVCRGNNHTYLICGYEQVGGLDLGFVLQVDTNFNFMGKVNIQVPANNRHTPALNIINSAFYEQPNPNLYFPPDPAGGYLITGFEAVGYSPTNAKSGYALKLSDGLTFQWMAKLDSPIPGGSPDWDMCSHGTYMWSGPKSYFVGGSGTSPAGEQVAMATEISMAGTLVWTKIYHDTNASGETSVAAAGAFDDQPIPMELYQITNHSSVQGGGFITFEQGTGTIILPKTRHIVTSTPDYYLYEFGATCAANVVIISGYGHNQTAGSTTGFFPFSFRYQKDLTQMVDPGFAKYAYPVQSAGYNPSTTIFDSYQTGGHPRIFYPKLFGQLAVNELTLAAFEDIGTEEENYMVHPYFNGTDSCAYVDPGFVSIPINITEWPANHQLGTYVITPGSYSDLPVANTLQQCNNCTVDPTFTITPGAACNYTFTANNPNFCPLFTIYDNANNVLFTANAASANYTFLINGTYTICYQDCGMGTNGVVCRDTLCQTIQVNCPPPCPLDADFSFNVVGCCVSFQDLTPDGNPDGCEYWTFGNIQVTLAGDVTSFCFPGSGTYTVCHVDCCLDANGIATYHQVCKQVTVNCTPPCCLPTGINVTTSNCCISASPILPGGCTGSNFYYWTLSNGNFSTQANPTFCNLGSGYYTICLWAYCGKGQWAKFCKTVKVSCALPPPPPNGGGGTAKFSYNLNGTSIGLTPSPPPANQQITSHTWTFGDGQTSTATAPSHYYLRSGSYAITHTVEGIELGTGMPFTAEQTVHVTMALAPACGCVPPALDAMAGGGLVCDGENTVLLKLIDFASESDIEHQWMRSLCTSPGCPTSEFVEIPGAIGQHVWIDDVSTTSYFRCRSTSALGFVTWSNEVEVVQGEFDLNLSGPTGAICPDLPTALTATGAATYDWSTGETTSIITVAPVTSTTYSVDGTNTAGCMDGEEITVVIGTTEMELEFQTDGNPGQISWEIREQGSNNLVQSGAPGSIAAINGIQTIATCVPNGCFYLRVSDSGGDGITNGGYILRTAGSPGTRIIDNRRNFGNLAGGPPDVSQIAGNQGWCNPMSATTQPIFTSCDKLDWITGNYVVCGAVPAVSALWNASNTPAEAISGYEFQIFNPNGGYIFNRFRAHNVSDGFAPDNATRACHMKINNWAAAQHVPANLLMNVRIRTRMNGINGNWGPVCRFKIDPVAAACPLTNLLDIPGDPNLSCNSTRAYGSGNYIYARPVSGATQYQWRFRIDGEGFLTVRATSTYFIQLNWPTLPLQDGKTYQVEVRAFKGGAWCVDAAVPANCGFVNPCFVAWNPNKPCLLTIDNTPFDGGNENFATAAGSALRMYPNPNRGDQLYLSLDAVEEGVSTVSVDIFDLYSKQVTVRTIPVQDGLVNTVLDLEGDMANGMYMVHITAGGQRYTERLVIQR